MKGLLFLCFISLASIASDVPEADLDIFTDKPLKQMYFRYAEGSLRNTPAENWLTRWSRFDGIVLKAYPEEGAPFGEKERATLQRFKQKFPQKALFLHFNGRARDPDFREIVSSPQDYLYFAGTTNLSPVSASENKTTIRVDDPNVFARSRTLPDGVYDDVVIAKRNTNSSIDWSNFEHAKLLSVNLEKGLIVVQRDILNTGRVNLGKGQAYIARHAAKGPFFAGTKQRLWEYNWFAAGKKSDKKTRLQDTLSDFLASKLSGEAQFFDGVSLDVLTETRLARVGGYPTGLDLDQDGRADSSSSEFDLLHASAIYEFLKLLREKLPQDKLIFADGSYGSQRAVHLLNGIESEGWPSFRDPELLHWSSGLNRHQYWNTFGVKPQASYFKLSHYLTPENKKVNPTDKVRRLTVAAALMTDSIVVPAFKPKGVPFHKWPEFRELKNLGKALGPAQPLRLSKKTRLIGSDISKAQLQATVSKNVSFSIAPEGIKLLNVSEANPFCVQTNLDAKEFTVSILAKTKSDVLLPQSRPVVMLVQADNSSATLKSYIGETFFQTEHYFNKADGREICISRETLGDITLASVDVYVGPYVLTREYENALLVANPSHQAIKYPQGANFADFNDKNLDKKVRGLLIPMRDMLIVR